MYAIVLAVDRVDFGSVAKFEQIDL